MQTIFRSILVLVALGGPAWGLATAQTPVLRSEGKILLLDTDRAMEGDILRLGEKFRIRRSVGELWLPAKRVKFVGNSWAEAVAFMRSRANLGDADERLRLARWCQANSKYELALEEIKQALKLHPDHPRARYLLRTVKRSAEIARRPAVKAKPQKPLPPPPSLDLNAESASAFIIRIQPILMNSCARCHANGRGGNFRLKHVYGNGAGNRRSTMHNLAAVVGHIHPERPALSRLLIKAVSAHGNAAKPPIKSRRSQPFQLLRWWVESTLASNPHLKEDRRLRTKEMPQKTYESKGASHLKSNLFNSAARRAVSSRTLIPSNPNLGAAEKRGRVHF